MNVQNNPKSARAVDTLTWAYVLSGNQPLAIQTNKIAREIDPKDMDRWDSIEVWLNEYEAFVDKPFVVSETTLNSYAGAYDLGQVSVQDGHLIFRQSLQTIDRRLIPASTGTFYVEGDLQTKLQFRTKPNGGSVDLIVSKIPCS